MNEDRFKKVKKKTAALVASTSLLVSGVLTAPANLPEEVVIDKISAPPAIAYVLPDLPDDDGDEDAVAPEEEKKKKFSLSSWYATRKFGVRLLLSIAFAALCWLLLGIAYFYLAPAMPVFVNFVVKTVLIAVLALTTYAAIAKAIVPNAKLSQILNWKPIVIIIIIACAISYGLEFIFSSFFVHI